MLYPSMLFILAFLFLFCLPLLLILLLLLLILLLSWWCNMSSTLIDESHYCCVIVLKLSTWGTVHLFKLRPMKSLLAVQTPLWHIWRDSTVDSQRTGGPNWCWLVWVVLEKLGTRLRHCLRKYCSVFLLFKYFLRHSVLSGVNCCFSNSHFSCKPAAIARIPAQRL